VKILAWFRDHPLKKPKVLKVKLKSTSLPTVAA